MQNVSFEVQPSVEKLKTYSLLNGILIPNLGFGLFGFPDAEEATKATLQALENGYRHLDTATRYQNEAAIGEGIRQSGLRRKDIFLTTKVWNDMQRAGQVRRSLEESLCALGVEYVDLFLIHWPVPEYYLQTWKVMEALQKEGLTRAIGVCNCGEKELNALREVSNTVPAVNQIELQPYFQQTELLNYCSKRGILVESWGTLTSGKTKLLQEPLLTEIGGKYGKSPAQVIIRWNLQRGVLPIVKSGNLLRQRQNLDVFDFALSDEDMLKIKELDCGQRIGRDPANSDF